MSHRVAHADDHQYAEADGTDDDWSLCNVHHALWRHSILGRLHIQCLVTGSPRGDSVVDERVVRTPVLHQKCLDARDVAHLERHVVFFVRRADHVSEHHEPPNALQRVCTVACVVRPSFGGLLRQNLTIAFRTVVGTTDAQTFPVRLLGGVPVALLPMSKRHVVVELRVAVPVECVERITGTTTSGYFPLWWRTPVRECVHRLEELMERRDVHAGYTASGPQHLPHRRVRVDGPCTDGTDHVVQSVLGTTIAAIDMVSQRVEPLEPIDITHGCISLVLHKVLRVMYSTYHAGDGLAQQFCQYVPLLHVAWVAIARDVQPPPHDRRPAVHGHPDGMISNDLLEFRFAVSMRWGRRFRRWHVDERTRCKGNNDTRESSTLFFSIYLLCRNHHPLLFFFSLSCGMSAWNTGFHRRAAIETYQPIGS